MHHRCAVLLALFALACAPLRAADSAPAECRPRGGVPNALAKLRAGEPMRVAYLGGSITAQAGGWRDKSFAWLQARYPAARLEPINATVPGTGSDLGVFRYRHDVLAFKPDLVFVEFAVNDARTAPATIERSMEGIVRQTWRQDPTTDLCFVYTISRPILDELDAGRTPPSVAAMERVADYYGIPSIHYGPEVAKEVAARTLVFQAPVSAFTVDGTHPTPAGHEVYQRIFSRAWPQLESAASGRRPHPLGAPLRRDNLESARMVPIGRELLRGSWRTVDLATSKLGRTFAPRLDSLWQAAAPGASLSFSFAGSYAAVYDLMGPDCGEIVVQIGGEARRTVPRFDGYCVSHRLAVVRLVDGAAGIPRRITITLSASAPNKREILFPANRPDLAAHPEKYAGEYWYAGALLLAGGS